MPTDQLTGSIEVPEVEGEVAGEEIPAWRARGRRYSRRARRLGKRALTTSVKSMRTPAGRAALARQAKALTEEDSAALAARPQSRDDCEGHAGPCPWVGCKHHLYLDVNPETGSIKINFPDLEPWELRASCALDIAALGGSTLDEVGDIMNLTKERVRQIEIRGLLKLKVSSPSPDEIGAEPQNMRLVKGYR